MDGKNSLSFHALRAFIAGNLEIDVSCLDANSSIAAICPQMSDPAHRALTIRLATLYVQQVYGRNPVSDRDFSDREISFFSQMPLGVLSEYLPLMKTL